MTHAPMIVQSKYSMFVSDLFEAHLPVAKGSLRNARRNYDAVVCSMNPQDFIRLTTAGKKSYNDIFKHDYVDLDTYRGRSDPRFNPESYEGLPYLSIVLKTGKVISHEGRHRAAMISKAGGTTFPCTISFLVEPTYHVTWREERDDGQDDFVEKIKVFNDPDLADDFVRKLEAHDGSDGIFLSRIRSDSDGYTTMKGSPRSQGWDKKPWLLSDVPPQFIGQYDDSIVIPTSKMRFGLVKGYTHYR